MSDLVERLRREFIRESEMGDLLEEAADEIERLRRVERAARDFLREIGGPDHDKAMDKLIDASDA